jgi:hypothetical protein
MDVANQQAALACIRCDRSEHDHDLARSDGADEIQRRIWKALGWPCPEFTLTAARVFAGQQARTSRWAPRRGSPPSAALAVTASAPPVIAAKGAAAARQALGLTRRNDTEGS